MALSEDQKEKIFADFNTDSYTQRELAKKHGVGIGTINRLTKGKTPQNGTLVEQVVQTTIKQNVILEQMEQKSGTEQKSIIIAANKQLDKTMFKNQIHNDVRTNQELVGVMQQQMAEFINDDAIACDAAGKKSSAAIELGQSIMLASKISDTNNTTIFGKTQPEEEKEDKKGSFLQIMVPEKDKDN